MFGLLCRGAHTILSPHKDIAAAVAAAVDDDDDHPAIIVGGSLYSALSLSLSLSFNVCCWFYDYSKHVKTAQRTQINYGNSFGTDLDLPGRSTVKSP